MSERNLPEWEQLLSAAAHLQEILPGTTLVGGTAVAIFAQHRLSRDADHVLPDLRERFDEVLAQLEAVAGWRTARVRRPVLILGSLDGIETGVRQMIREEPLETGDVSIAGVSLVVPTEEELLRIKAVLILRRNATREVMSGGRRGWRGLVCWSVRRLKGLALMERRLLSERSLVPRRIGYGILLSVFEMSPGNSFSD